MEEVEGLSRRKAGSCADGPRSTKAKSVAVVRKAHDSTEGQTRVIDRGGRTWPGGLQVQMRMCHSAERLKYR